MIEMGKLKNQTHRAREALLLCGKDFPNAWSQYNGFLSQKGQPDFDWPDWCFVPMSAAQAIVQAQLGTAMLLTAMKRNDIARVAALAAWRMTQGIYRFDPSVYEAVINTPVAGDLPAHAVMQLPEWCVYIETPNNQTASGLLHGFWAHLEFDFSTKRTELRLLLDYDDHLEAIPLHIGDGTLADSLQRAVEVGMNAGQHLFGAADAGDVTSQVVSHQREKVQPLISLLLYLCSTNDYSRAGQPGQPKNPTPTRTRRDGAKLFPANVSTQWDVGVRMGSALRKAYHAEQTEQAGSDGSSRRGHIRRAHWHGYWSGPRKDEHGQDVPQHLRKFDLRWQPPIAVNLADLDTMPSTIRPVK